MAARTASDSRSPVSAASGSGAVSQSSFAAGTDPLIASAADSSDCRSATMPSGPAMPGQVVEHARHPEQQLRGHARRRACPASAPTGASMRSDERAGEHDRQPAVAAPRAAAGPAR